MTSSPYGYTDADGVKYTSIWHKRHPALGMRMFQFNCLWCNAAEPMLTGRSDKEYCSSRCQHASRRRQLLDGIDPYDRPENANRGKSKY